ncbi:HAD-IA family hydrolase [Candidatus Roizmanbacteria bacterium]|nr:HAD-IA family hydrolase [Candidatus Roizmanbacteria bacterium]
MIKVILFDIDGVLINGKRFSEMLEIDYGVSVQETLPFFTGAFRDCLIGKADIKKELVPFLPVWGWKKSVDELLAYWFKSECKLDEELAQYTQTLRAKGIICCLATNQEKYRVEYLLEHLGFARKFDHIFPSAHLGYAKPHTGFFEQIESRLLGIRRDEIILWDDTPGHVEAAQQFGIHAEVYTDFTSFREIMERYFTSKSVA